MTIVLELAENFGNSQTEIFVIDGSCFGIKSFEGLVAPGSSSEKLQKDLIENFKRIATKILRTSDLNIAFGGKTTRKNNSKKSRKSRK